MRIALASDHGGFILKEKIKDYLIKKGLEAQDFGCFSEENVDYPDFIKKACLAVSEQKANFAFVFCGSGVGASIVANKIKGIRCVLCTSEYLAEYSRLHNDANVMAIGGRLTTEELAKRYIEIFLKTSFEGGRHQKRIDKIKEIE